MSTSETGLEIDEHADLVVDPAGDIGRVSGGDVVQTDIAYRVARDLDGFSAVRLTRGVQQDIQAVVASAILDDPRVREIRNLEIRRSDGDSGPIGSGSDIGITIEHDVVTNRKVIKDTLDL